MAIFLLLPIVFLLLLSRNPVSGKLTILLSCKRGLRNKLRCMIHKTLRYRSNSGRIWHTLWRACRKPFEWKNHRQLLRMIWTRMSRPTMYFPSHPRSEGNEPFVYERSRILFIYGCKPGRRIIKRMILLSMATKRQILARRRHRLP